MADGADTYAAAVAADDRLPGDYDRDAGRKPAAVLEFLGAEPGDAVLDLFSGGGYLTELLSRVVGPDGVVLAHTTELYISYVGDEFAARYADDRLPNVEVLIAENNELELTPGSLDVVLMVLAYHDTYLSQPAEGWEPIDRPRLLAELRAGLKPGGVLGIVDHAAPPGDPAGIAESLHRVDRAQVINDLEAAGFELDGSSDLLRNPDDDRTRNVFDPDIRGKTDQFMLRFRKPE